MNFDKGKLIILNHVYSDTTAQKKNFEKKRYLKQCRAINFYGIFQISKITES